MTSLRLKPACLDLYPEFALACRRDAWCISHGSVAGFDEAQTRVWLDTLTREQPQGLLHLWRHHSPIGQLELAPAMARMDGSLGGYIYLLYLVPQWRGRGLGAGCWNRRCNGSAPQAVPRPGCVMCRPISPPSASICAKAGAKRVAPMSEVNCSSKI
jgi:GNAT superfamily N-acetyltransferase